MILPYRKYLSNSVTFAIFFCGRNTVHDIFLCSIYVQCGLHFFSDDPVCTSRAQTRTHDRRTGIADSPKRSESDGERSVYRLACFASRISHQAQSLVEFARSDVHECIYNELLYVVGSSNLQSRNITNVDACQLQKNGIRIKL